MQASLIHALPYLADTTAYFARLKDEPWAILLDSGQPVSQYGRFDVMVARPVVTIKTIEKTDGKNGEIVTEISQNGQVTTRYEDPFFLLNQLLGEYKAQDIKPSHLPFCGGAVGYFGYDLARQVEHLPNTAQKNPAIPHMMVGIYDWALVIDHRMKTAQLVSLGLTASTHEHWATICALFETPQAKPNMQPVPFKLTHAIVSNMNVEEYGEKFAAIKRYILEGDCYQVNLAQRFSAAATGDAWQAYQKLREISPAPFMAYMNFGDLQVLSGSPERFLQVVNGHVETRPIKGTRPRDADEKRDQQQAQALKNSLKDRAENLMIVDLLRNDISKNCETGSVKADHLFQLQSFANVHHLVSIITGKLAKTKTAIDLLRGCFPGGSITGAPKLRSMQIIEALEPHRRGVYCGAIGYIGYDGNMDTNITIRTAVYSQGEISFYAGGGIVADSVLEKEYNETLDKASSMMKTMQSFME